nr:ATP-binding cassette domain-containing protein [Actinomyces minihominis]
MSTPLLSSHLHVDGLSKSYPDRRVLTDISFTVTPGEVVGLIGENGSGKTTLLKIIAGLVEADAGSAVLTPFSWMSPPITSTTRRSTSSAPLSPPGPDRFYLQVTTVPSLTRSPQSSLTSILHPGPTPLFVNSMTNNTAGSASLGSPGATATIYCSALRTGNAGLNGTATSRTN